MAVNQDNATFTASVGNTQPPQQPQQPPAATWGLFGSGSLNTAVSRTPTSEVVGKAALALKETYSKQNLVPGGYSVSVIQVDNTRESAVANLAFSSIVITSTSDDPKVAVSYHTLILEGSGEPLAARTVNIPGLGNTTVDRTTSAAYNDRYRETVEAVVGRQFPNRKLANISSQVVPRSFNWEDADMVRRLAVNALLPVITNTKTQEPDFVDCNMANFAGDANFQASIQFNQTEFTDYANLPVRQPITIALNASSKQNENVDDANSFARTRKITTVGGFIDAVYVGPINPQANFGNFQPQQPINTSIYQPRFVATRMESEIHMTIPSQLWALATAKALAENYNWLNYFVPRKFDSSFDPRDIGALNIEANIDRSGAVYGAPWPTKSANFSTQDLGRFALAVFRPELAICMDVSDAGSDTWFNEVFAAGSNNNAKAQQAILRGANYLTGGVFSQHYNTNESPVIVNNERVLLGTYKGSDGVLHDIRDIDYPYVANFAGEKGAKDIEAWSETYNSAWPLEKAMAARRQMISAIAPGDVNFTGEAQRVTFTATFLDALVKSLMQVGFKARPVLPTTSGEFQSNRASNALPQALNSPVASGLFNAQYSNSGTESHGHRDYGSNRSW